MAVTKSFDIPTTQALITAGVEAIGENRLEVAAVKFPHLAPVEKHFIGQIQSKKIKKIVEWFDVIQSVGTTEHLLKIEAVARELKKKIDVFLQFNISGEVQKAGYSLSQIEEIKEALNKIHFIQVTGVMGMASDTSDTVVIRHQFQNLRKIRNQLQKEFPSISELSIGMSADYTIAIEEGATLVRIGRSLFA